MDHLSVFLNALLAALTRSAHPWPIPAPFGPMQVAVEGRLELLEPEKVDYVYQFNNAKIVPMRPEEIIDTSGIDMCGVFK